MLYLFGQGERADYFRNLKYLQEHEKLLSDLSETELNTLCFEVDYCVEKQQYKVCEYDIVIEDSIIVEALDTLSENKKNIVLLAFFMEMSETEIAREMNLACSTVCEHRKRALKMMKEAMKKRENG